MTGRAVWSVVAVCALLPATGSAQHVHGSAGYTHNGYPYGPRVAPGWGYPGLYGGPFVGYAGAPFRSGFTTYDQLSPNVGVYTGFGYPGFGSGYPGFGYPGYFGYSGRVGNQWSNGLSLYGPPVPVYGPIPGVFGNNDLVRNYRAHPGIAGYGWVGIYAASPRPRPLTVSVHPTVERFHTAPAEAVPAAPGGCLILSVKVPQPAAEVFVDGKKTAQTGTDRIFESPPLEAGKAFKYTVTARWVERGQLVESSREVSGTPGEVVRVDFGVSPVVGR